MTSTAITHAAVAALLRKDPPRINPRTGEEEKRVRLRVECASEGVVCDGGLLNVGTHYVEVYESQVKTMMDLVETWLREPIVRVGLRVKQSTVLREEGAPEPQAVERTERVSEVDERQLEGKARERAAAANRERVDEEYRNQQLEAQEAAAGIIPRYTRPFLPSLPAAFRHVMRRDMRPFLACEVLTATPKNEGKEQRAA